MGRNEETYPDPLTVRPERWIPFKVERITMRAKFNNVIITITLDNCCIHSPPLTAHFPNNHSRPSQPSNRPFLSGPEPVFVPGVPSRQTHLSGGAHGHLRGQNRHLNPHAKPQLHDRPRGGQAGDLLSHIDHVYRHQAQR